MIKKWLQFVEEKNEMVRPEQGKGANPYLPLGKQNVGVRVAKDSEKKEPFGDMGGSNVRPEDSSLGEKGGKGGVPITEDKMKSAYPNGKADGRIRVTKDKEKGKNFADLKTPGMEPSTSSLGEKPGKGVGTTNESELSTDDYIQFVLKKK